MPVMTMSDGCSLYYRLDGQEGAPAIVFSNPHGFTHELWDPQVQQLASDFRILRYDNRGHGASDVPPGPYSVERMALDARELIEGLGLASAGFCGLSIGGMVGMWLGFHAPGVLSRAVLANTSAHLDPSQALEQRLELIHAEGMDAAVADVMARSLTQSYQADNPRITARLAEIVASTPPAGYIAGGEAVLDFDFRDSISAIDLPVLVIAGEQDPATPTAMGAAIAGAVPGAELVYLDASHLSNIEQASAFNDLIRDFFSRS